MHSKVNKGTLEPMNTKYNLYVLDTETTGNTPKDRLTKVAYKKIGNNEITAEFFKPPIPISVESMEVTHITEETVADKPAFEGSSTWQELKDIFADENNILVAHNAAFDMMILKNEGITVKNCIDTMKIARYLDTNNELTSVRLQYLRYFWKLPIVLPPGMFAHDARADIIVCEALLNKLEKDLAEVNKIDGEILVAEMIDISMRPSLIRIFNFGKYKGEKIEDIAKKDRGYLVWLYEQKKQTPDTEADWLFTLETYLKPQGSLF